MTIYLPYAKLWYDNLPLCSQENQTMRVLLQLLSLLYILILMPIAGAKPSSQLQHMEQTIIDAVITTKITAKFAKNNHLNPLKIKVFTEDGIVRLTGSVKDHQAYVDALKLVKNTAGVKKINTTNLIIKPINTAFIDAYITAKVETAVLRAKVFDDESIPLAGINAKTVNGTVTLTGEVHSEKSALAIIERVNKLRGVKKIISHIEVIKKDNRTIV